MAMWRANTKLLESEKLKRNKDGEKAIQSHSSDIIPVGFRKHARIDSADNRRAAGIYVKNF